MSLAQLTILLKAVYQHSMHYNLLARVHSVGSPARGVWRAVTQNRLQDKRGKYMGAGGFGGGSFERDWRAFREEETGTRQLKADIIRQVCVCVCVCVSPGNIHLILTNII